MGAEFIVRTRPDLSLARLVDIQTAGGAVLRSAHPGNWSPSNLAVAALGLRCVLTDLTLTGADDIYYPSGVIVGRKFHPGLCRPGNTLVSRTPVRQLHWRTLPPGLDQWFPPAKNLADAHNDAVRKAIATADIQSFGQYAAEQHDLTVRVLSITADLMPELWRRRTDPTAGVIDITRTAVGDITGPDCRRTLARPTGWQYLQRDGVLGITDDSTGWLIPKEVMCLLMAVLDTQLYRTTEVYHLSGVRMMNYIADMLPTLQRLYAAVAPRLRLPESLVFHLVPTANMTLFVPASDQAVLDRLVDLYLTVFGRTSTGPRSARFQARCELAWAANSCAIPFFDVRDADYFTQYDLLVRGSDWHLNPWALQAPLRDVGQLVTHVSTLRKAHPR